MLRQVPVRREAGEVVLHIDENLTPDDGWQSAADITELSWISQSSADNSAAFARAPRKTVGPRVLALILGAMALVALSALTTFLISRKATSGPVVRATLYFPPNVTLLTLDLRVPAEINFDAGIGDTFSGCVAGSVVSDD